MPSKENSASGWLWVSIDPLSPTRPDLGTVVSPSSRPAQRSGMGLLLQSCLQITSDSLRAAGKMQARAFYDTLGFRDEAVQGVGRRG